MLKDSFQLALENWKLYWGDGYMVWLLAGAVLILLVFSVWEQDARGLLLYSAGTLFIIFCPLTAWILTKLLGENVYWRMLWLLPSGIMTAYAFTRLVTVRKTLWLRIPGTIVFVVLIAFCGKSQLLTENYEWTHNSLQLPDDIVQMGEMIKEDADKPDVLVAGDFYVSSYMRVYDASFRMPYGLHAEGASSQRERNLYDLLQGEPQDDPERFDKMLRTARQLRCDYVAARYHITGMEEICSYRKWRILGEAGNYHILARIKNPGSE